MVNCAFLWSRASDRCEPIKPAPPVSKMRWRSIVPSPPCSSLERKSRGTTRRVQARFQATSQSNRNLPGKLLARPGQEIQYIETRLKVWVSRYPAQLSACTRQNHE